MSIDTTRRGFLVAAAGIAGLSAASATPVIENETGGFKLGVASYSVRMFQRAQAIKLIKEVQTPYVSIKDMHLPYNSTAAEIAAGRKQFENAGLKIMSGGVIYLLKNDEADMRQYFEYAKACGMPMIICGPTHENVKLLEKLVREYDIKGAIHNHGPQDKNFPTPQSVLEVVKDLDPRVGLCIDLGHSTQAGVDVVKSIADAGPRLLDMHIKDLTDKASPCDVGEGIIPIVACFKQLEKIGYTGCVNLEQDGDQSDVDAPLTGMLKSFAYMRGVLAGLKG
jgi:sugar phosphate isomerase/epimerase